MVSINSFKSTSIQHYVQFVNDGPHSRACVISGSKKTKTKNKLKGSQVHKIKLMDPDLMLFLYKGLLA